jgi:plasmid maintenance system killer protein
MEPRFEKAFVEAVRKYSSIKKQVERKVQQIIEHPIALGEPLKGNLRGFYSTPVKRNFLIIFLYCSACRKKGDDKVVLCSDCADCKDETVKFVLLAPHDQAYGR